MRRFPFTVLPLLVSCTALEAPTDVAVPARASAIVSSPGDVDAQADPSEPLPSISSSPVAFGTAPAAAAEAAPVVAVTPEPVTAAPAKKKGLGDLPYPEAIPAAAVTSVDPRWSEAARFDDAVTLVAVDDGLLGRVGGVAHEWVDGVWEARPQVDAERPRALRHAAQIEGRWGENAWRISAQEHNGERESYTDLRFMRWRGNHKWVSQKIPEPLGYEGARSYGDMGTALVRTSERGGLLLADMAWEPTDGLQIVRIAGGAASPGFEPFAEDMEAIDLYETKGGRVFVFGETYNDDRFIVQRSCRDDDTVECVRKHAVRLPKTADRRWVPTHMAATGRNAVAFVVREGVRDDDAARHYLLRNAGGRFRFESIPAGGKIKQLLSGDEGGLWAVAETGDADAVLYRSAGGDWHDVVRPEAIADDGLTLARGADGIWISGSTGTKALYRADFDPTAPEPVAGLEPGGGSVRTGAP